MRWSGIGLLYLLLAVVEIGSGTGFAQYLTSSPANSRTKALQDIEASESSNLGAIPASVDELLDRRIKPQVQEVFPDANLRDSNLDAPDPSLVDSPSSADYQKMYRPKMTGTSWSPLPPAMSATDTPVPLSGESDTSVAKVLSSPTLGTTAETDTNFRLDSDENPHPNRKLSRPQIQQQERAKRQAREMHAQSDRQCDQLRSGALECRSKLTHADAVSRHLPRRLAESPITTR
jgi:hypothetical protein